jgi:hypothetical protein
MFQKIGPIAAALLLVTARENTQPVVVIAANGQVLRGVATGNLCGGGTSGQFIFGPAAANF